MARLDISAPDSWRHLLTFAQNHPSDEAWAKVDRFMIEYCESPMANPKQIAAMAIERLGGNPGSPIEAGPDSSIWCEKALQEIYKRAS